MTVMGTRPDTIKMAPVVLALAAAGTAIESVVCVTAQHREMLDEVLTLFRIEPDYDLNIMTRTQSLTDITTRVLVGMERVLDEVKPDVVLVHGDTTTSTAAALAAFYAKIPVGHVEAGLRTSSVHMPFPEELNRRLTSVIANYHFAPTSGSQANLFAERIERDCVVVTGNTVIDAFLDASRRPYQPPEAIVSRDPSRPLIYVTAHRRENHQHMAEICRALAEISLLPQHPEILWPVHPSPMVAPIAHQMLAGVPGIRLVPPLGYADSVASVSACSFVLTDSGGLQEEAPTLGKPVLVLRNETERPEGLAAGTLRLIGTDRARIVEECQHLLSDASAYRQMAHASNPYGDGKAAERIVSWLLWKLRSGAKPMGFLTAA
jgi:UDP-N-acetylglucosamine 2-epimerase (non-hydrolysing)